MVGHAILDEKDADCLKTTLRNAADSIHYADQEKNTMEQLHALTVEQQGLAGKDASTEMRTIRIKLEQLGAAHDKAVHEIGAVRNALLTRLMSAGEENP